MVEENLPTRSPESTMSDEERLASFGWGILLMGLGFPFAYAPFGLTQEDIPEEMVCCLFLPITGIGIAMMVMGARSFWGALTNKQLAPPVLGDMRPARSWGHAYGVVKTSGQDPSATENQTTPERDDGSNGQASPETNDDETDSFWEQMRTPDDAGESKSSRD